ncbi:MAG: MBL fold metallo-hydrolase [Anaerolineales bacterium]
MKIHFLGGADEVGASCVLLEMGGQRILVDAGIRVSPKARDGLSGELLPDLSPLNDGKLDAVIVTHAHADHIGAVPLVLGSLPHVPVYTTPATLSLMSVMFRDALRIMDSRLEAEGELPTYDLLQVQRVEEQARATDLRQEFSINGAVNVTFYRAGHIPGAASVFLQSDEGSILVSGDLSFSPMRATPMAEIPPVRPDALILESTYGGKLHANRHAEEQRLIDSITEVIDRGGRVLIPAFALGRAQEVALVLDAAMKKRKMAKVPVYMDGMTRSITQVFERFPDYLSRDLYRHLEEDTDLFQTDQINFIKSVDHRESIARGNDPAVIISSSGMLTGGASPYYAQHLVGDSRNAIFITGYQDEESPGKALQRLAAEEGGMLTLYGRRYEVKCNIDTYSLSAHADENELTQFATQLEPDVIYMVHGDGDARSRMRDLIRQRRLAVALVRMGQEVDVEGNRPLGRRKDVPRVPNVVTPAITSLDEIDMGLPLFDPSGELYVRNARKAIEKLMPAESGLRKLTFKKDERVLKMTFDFPAVIVQQYADEIQKVENMLGWSVKTNDSVNMNALNDVAEDIFPGMVGRVSIHLAQQAIEVRLKQKPDNWDELQTAFQERTGFQVFLKGGPGSENANGGGGVALVAEAVQPRNADGQMEINAAYATLKSALATHGLYKAGLKNGRILLSFVTPQQGEAISDKLQELADEVGYGLDVHPHPNQHSIIQRVIEMCKAHDIELLKNPSLLIAEQAVVIEPLERPAPDVAEHLQTAFHDDLHWDLQIKTVEMT